MDLTIISNGRTRDPSLSSQSLCLSQSDPSTMRTPLIVLMLHPHTLSFGNGHTQGQGQEHSYGKDAIETPVYQLIVPSFKSVPGFGIVTISNL